MLLFPLKPFAFRMLWINVHVLSYYSEILNMNQSYLPVFSSLPVKFCSTKLKGLLPVHSQPCSRFHAPFVS